MSLNYWATSVSTCSFRKIILFLLFFLLSFIHATMKACLTWVHFSKWHSPRGTEIAWKYLYNMLNCCDSFYLNFLTAFTTTHTFMHIYVDKYRVLFVASHGKFPVCILSSANFCSFAWQNINAFSPSLLRRPLHTSREQFVILIYLISFMLCHMHIMCVCMYITYICVSAYSMFIL